jgi:L-threonylcarbamoyladenylate synthase
VSARVNGVGGSDEFDGADEVGRAVEVLRGGGLVAFPTETVYGLGADASQAEAVRRIYAVKQRPADHPLIVHLAGSPQLDDWAIDVPDDARRLAELCWPGPLTLLLRRHLAVDATPAGGRDTIGLRVPAHPLALELLDRFGGGIAAPSANRFGRVSPTTAEHVRADLGDLVDVVLDGGPCPIGIESTIVDCTTMPFALLRPGAIPVEAIETHLGVEIAAATGSSRAPGMLTSHYAPAAEVRLAEDSAAAIAVAAVEQDAGARVELIDPGDDLLAYARGLYAWLRAADEHRADVVVAVLPPPQGLGLAIRDRLRKAAAPR